jgi:hypothetical protein
MSGNRHPKGHETNDIDLKANPGIGQGAAINNVQTTFEDEAGRNTTEGDVMNDTTPAGGVNPRQRGRTNP